MHQIPAVEGAKQDPALFDADQQKSTLKPKGSCRHVRHLAKPACPKPHSRKNLFPVGFRMIKYPHVQAA